VSLTLLFRLTCISHHIAQHLTEIGTATTLRQPSQIYRIQPSIPRESSATPFRNPPLNTNTNTNTRAVQPTSSLTQRRCTFTFLGSRGWGEETERGERRLGPMTKGKNIGTPRFGGFSGTRDEVGQNSRKGRWVWRGKVSEGLEIGWV
jgi:hypothetical protein